MEIGVLCALLAGAMWGMVFIAPRALPAFSPWELTLGRYLAYGVIAAIAAAPILPRIARKITRADCWSGNPAAATLSILFSWRLACSWLVLRPPR